MGGTITVTARMGRSCNWECLLPATSYRLASGTRLPHPYRTVTGWAAQSPTPHAWGETATGNACYRLHATRYQLPATSYGLPASSVAQRQDGSRSTHDIPAHTATGADGHQAVDSKHPSSQSKEGGQMNQPKKCAHPACSCMTTDKYCSSYCKDQKDSLEISCGCGHPNCTGHIT